MRHSHNRLTFERPAAERPEAGDRHASDRAAAIRAKADRLYMMGELARAARLLMDLEEKRSWA